jgi:ribosomal protein L34E
MFMPKEETPPEVAAYFRQFADRRKKVPHVCDVCGKPFEGLSWARHCSQACSSKAARRRRGQKT